MLKSLTINNYALIDGLDCSFGEHLNIITGETGAGKSILLGALSLLLGGRSDVNAIKDTKRNCVIEGEFVSSTCNSLIIRRVISSSGRSRFFIDDEPASAEQVKSIGSSLVDIHSQNGTMLIKSAAFQMEVLDSFADNISLIAQYKDAYDRLVHLRKELSDLQEDLARSNRDKDYARFQYDKLSGARLKEGELEELETEQAKLANAEQIKEHLLTASSLLNSDVMSISTALKEATAALRKIKDYIAQAEDLAGRMEICRIELQDIGDEIERHQESVSVSPQRLTEVEDRIGEIYDLLRKYGKENVTELICLQSEYASQLEAGDNLALQIAEKEAELKNVQHDVEKMASRLHDRRAAMCELLANVLQERIRLLEIPYACFKIRLTKLDELTPNGSDSITFLFSANGESEPGELAKYASGGEISRVMLCIKSIMAEHTEMPTMIFDEIDTGVSGSVADKMGSMIVSLSSRQQVMAITHLPQVASKGSSHLLVYKTFDADGQAHSHIRHIDGEERVKEIARMLSGSSLTPEALANAAVLLNN